MGVNFLSRSCWTNSEQVAPNPAPDRWQLLAKAEFAGGYVLKVRYFDCTNFEGEKVMVFRGQYRWRSLLDPHFQPTNDSPIARFRPDQEGWNMAIAVAQSLTPIV